MYWACMSVGKPGYSSVEMSAARKRSVAADADRAGTEHVDAHAVFAQFGDDGADMIDVAVGHNQIAAGDGAGDEEGSRFYAVGVDAVARAMKPGYAAHANGGCAGALESVRPWR